MKRALIAVAGALIGAGTAAMDIDRLWNFDDPAASEARFRAALADARGDDALVLRTQIARTHSLRRDFAAAHAELDAVEPALAGAGVEPRVRAALERGRSFRSAGEPARAKPLFEQAAALAQGAGLDALAIDAWHMFALVEPEPEAQLAANRRALAAARAASAPAARHWDAALLNNIGMALHGLGRYDEALAAFRDAQAARERLGDSQRTRIARWMVAWTLRALRRHDEALAMLQALEREFAAAGAADGWVFEEIGENLEATGRAAEARPWFAKAHDAHAADRSPGRPDAADLARLKQRAGGG